MTIGPLIIWIIVGAVTGILLDILMGGMRIGLMGAMLIGIVGAVISGWAFNLIGYHFMTGIIGLIVEALIGAVALLLLFGVFRRY